MKQRLNYPFILKYNCTTQNPEDLISNWILRRIAKQLHVAYKMFCKQTCHKKFLPIFHWSKDNDESTTATRRVSTDSYISAAKCSSEILSADGLVWTDRPETLTADHMAIVQWETCCAWTKASTTGDVCRQGPDHSANVHFRPPSL